jgi:hypothetical protein
MPTIPHEEAEAAPCRARNDTAWALMAAERLADNRAVCPPTILKATTTRTDKFGERAGLSSLNLVWMGERWGGRGRLGNKEVGLGGYLFGDLGVLFSGHGLRGGTGYPEIKCV